MSDSRAFKSVRAVGLCAPLIGLPIFVGGILAIVFIGPLSSMLFRLGLTSGYVTDGKVDAGLIEIATGVVAAMCAGFILGLPVLLLGAIAQPPPNRVARSIRNGPKALLILSPLLVLLNTIAWSSMFVNTWVDGHLDMVWMSIAAMVPPLICVCMFAWQRRVRAWWITRLRRRRTACAACGYDLRKNTSDRCPECGAKRD